MSGRWLDTLKHEDRADLGAALVRLARLAESVHRFEACRELRDVSHPGVATLMLDRAAGGSVGSAVHTEVNP